MARTSMNVLGFIIVLFFSNSWAFAQTAPLSVRSMPADSSPATLVAANSAPASSSPASSSPSGATESQQANKTGTSGVTGEPASLQNKAIKPSVKAPVKVAKPPVKTQVKAPVKSRKPVPTDKRNSSNEGSQKNSKGLLVKEIRIEGYKKIERDAILNRINIKEGSSFDPMAVRQDIINLFATHFFYDVDVESEPMRDGVALIYRVTERPSVTEIVFDGNSELKDTELTETSDLKAFEILDTSKLQVAVEKIQKAYEEKGYFLAEVKYSIEPIGGGDTVRVRFKIVENDKVKVKRIHFIGNTHLTAVELKNAMLTKEGGFFSFVSGSGSYKQEAFDQDLRILNYTYVNKGYINVKISRPEVTVTPDKRGIYITVQLEEGDQFRVGKVEFSGDLLFSQKELFDAITIDESDIFVWEKVQKDLSTLQAKYGDLGYAYTNIIPKNVPHENEKVVDLLFEIDKGSKVYFGRINITGNGKTRDKVVRRELLINEGELYNETRKRESMDRVRRLGFFEDVQFNSSTPVDRQDIMDIEIVVKERNTGTIQVGAGYSTYSKFIFNGNVTQSNLLGRGQNLGISADVSKLQSLFNLNFTEPYFLDSKWSLGGDAFQRNSRRVEFNDVKKGGAIRVGHPIDNYWSIFGRYGLDKTHVQLDSTYGDPSIFPVDTVNGFRSAVSTTIQYDKRNDRMMPTDGIYSFATMEYAGLGGQIKYAKADLGFRFYKKIFWELVFRNNLSYGIIEPTGGGDAPFTELFRLGGPYSLRGFQFASVGKRRFSQKTQDYLTPAYGPEKAAQYANVVYGGSQQFYYQTELEFPLVKEANLRGVLFFDIGDASDSLSISRLRSDIGFGVRWFSPIGPLRFEWGFPTSSKRADNPNQQPVNFEFSIGSPF